MIYPKMEQGTGNFFLSLTSGPQGPILGPVHEDLLGVACPAGEGGAGWAEQPVEGEPGAHLSPCIWRASTQESPKNLWRCPSESALSSCWAGGHECMCAGENGPTPYPSSLMLTQFPPPGRIRNSRTAASECGRI